MRYITILSKTDVEQYLQEFKNAIKDVLGLKLEFVIDGFLYKSSNEINKDIFNRRNSIMEDVLGYGYKEKSFGKHSITTKSNEGILSEIDVYKFSFTNPDQYGVRFVVLFEKS